MKGIHEQNYYELLEITPAASQEEILAAYNRARATYGHNSPALYSLFNKEEAQELLRLIDEAYAVLSNQFKRKNYDSSKELRYQNERISDKLSDMGMSSGHDVASEAFIEDLAVPNVAPTDFKNTDSPRETFAPAPASGGSTGKTRFGTYPMNPAFENEIKTIMDFSGEVLKRIRQYKNVSIDQISESTKVSRTYLHAIENNDFRVLPARVFTRGFVVQYAKALELPEEKVAQSYINQMKDR